MTGLPARGRWALAALLAGASAIGLAPILVRFARAENVGPGAAAFWRLALALPVLWAWMLMERRRGTPPPARGVPLALFLTGISFAMDLAFWHVSILRTKVANATLLVCMASTFAAFASWLLFRERLRAGVVVGLSLALGGALLLMQGSSYESGQRLGDLASIAAAVWYAVYLLGIARLRSRCSTATSMAWSGLGATVGLLAAVALLREPLFSATPKGWFFVASLSVACQLAGQTLIAYSLAHLSMAFSAVAILVQPVVAAALSWMIFHESLLPVQLAGGALILGGIAAARLGSLSKA